MDAGERERILGRYANYSRQFDEAASRADVGSGVVLPFPVREREQEPTGREIEILDLISEGLTNREIGKRLFLSEETVKSHVCHLLAKLQATSRAQAVAIGFRRELLT